MTFDSCVVEFAGVSCFRPGNHPLRSVMCCKKCKKAMVSLPAYPGDWFDCESCGHSWPCTEAQLKRMNRPAVPEWQL